MPCHSYVPISTASVDGDNETATASDMIYEPLKAAEGGDDDDRIITPSSATLYQTPTEAMYELPAVAIQDVGLYQAVTVSEQSDSATDGHGVLDAFVEGGAVSQAPVRVATIDRFVAGGPSPTFECVLSWSG
jgi:hypothetical protein